jgi:uncharacterized protein
MRILIDIGHPAHVHLYRNFYHEMKKRGHELLVTVKYLPAAINLLEIYDIPFVLTGRKSDKLISKAFNQILYDIRVLSIVRTNKIETGIGSSLTLAHVSAVSKMKSIIFDDDDDEVQPLMTRFGHPFADILVSPEALKGKRRKKQTVFYPGYHELAYLHPNWFTPDPGVLAEMGLSMNESYFILRFNAYKAHHDKGESGLTTFQKTELVKFLETKGKVFITSENETEPELFKYKVTVTPAKMHSLMFFSTMFIGDSQTMTSEAAVLGVPSLRCNTFAGRISYLNEEEIKYNLTYAFRPEAFDKLMVKMKELISNPDLKNEWQAKREIMLSDKIDVTRFMMDLVENHQSNKL